MFVKGISTPSFLWYKNHRSAVFSFRLLERDIKIWTAIKFIIVALKRIYSLVSFYAALYGDEPLPTSYTKCPSAAFCKINDNMSTAWNYTCKHLGSVPAIQQDSFAWVFFSLSHCHVPIQLIKQTVSLLVKSPHSAYIAIKLHRNKIFALDLFRVKIWFGSVRGVYRYNAVDIYSIRLKKEIIERRNERGVQRYNFVCSNAL